MKSAAVFKDAAESAFADRRSLWWHLGLLAAGPLILFFAWPDASPAEYAARGSGPRSLRIVTMALAVYIFVSSGGWDPRPLPGAESDLPFPDGSDILQSLRVIGWPGGWATTWCTP